MKRLPLYLLIVVVVAAVVVALRTLFRAPAPRPGPPVETLPIAPDLDTIPGDSLYLGQIREYRNEVISFLRGNESPLEDGDRRNFRPPRFFPVDPGFRYRVRVERAALADTVLLLDTMGAERRFETYGALRFRVDGRPQSLTLFREPRHRYFFLPFRDGTSGRETYEMGRYVEPQPLGEDHFMVDFNRAYNPYCAYSDRWACPIPPPENHLSAAIRAGEMKYHLE